jgi:MFS family permease
MDDPRAARLTLVACILGSAIVFVDQTVVNVALPSLREDLDATLADQQWIVEAYLLLLSSLVLVGGALGDLYGRRRIFAIGVAGFGAASLVCAAAPAVEVLIAARALQGAFGALLVPSSLAIIAAVFTGAPRRRSRSARRSAG